MYRIKHNKNQTQKKTHNGDEPTTTDPLALERAAAESHRRDLNIFYLQNLRP